MAATHAMATAMAVDVCHDPPVSCTEEGVKWRWARLV